jgi:hypothetical protein
MNITRLAKIERLHNKLQAAVRDHFGQFTNDELLHNAEEFLAMPPERVLVALAHLEELLRRYETDAMNGDANQS